MVSKATARKRAISFAKQKPSPSLSRRRRPGDSPLKALLSAPSLVVASFRSCRRRLIRIFSRLSTNPTSTPPRRMHGFRRLNAVHDVNPVGHHFPFPDSLLLPPTQRKTLFLDLDETLVHSVTGATPEKYDFLVSPEIKGCTMNFYVMKRPGVDDFLEKISKSYEIVVFTAGLEEYASLVLNRLDLDRRLFSHRLYRSSCREVDGKLVKDLAATGRDLDRVFIVDDNPNVYALQPHNAIPITPFTGDFGDRELHRLVKFFEAAEKFEDTRDAIKLYLSGGNGKRQNETNTTPPPTHPPLPSTPAAIATTCDAVPASDSPASVAVPAA